MKRLVLLAVLVITALMATVGVASAQQGYASCDYAQYPRLVPGQQGRVTPGLPNIVRSQPYRGPASPVVGQIPANGVFTVLAGYGAQCGDGMWWVYVNYNGIVGWTPEGSADGVYWTEPVVNTPVPPPPVNCSPAPRLTVGGQGRITPGLPNVIRTQPFKGWGSLIIGVIPAGGTFTVVNGPSCANGINWWQVNYNGFTGWTGEGEAGVYWTEPVSVGIPTTCNAPSAHMTVGASGYVPNGQGTSLFALAGPSPEIGYLPGGSWFRVLSGPSCIQGINFYQVQYQAMIGWVMEGQNYAYNIEPFVCGGFIPSRLVPGAAGRVLPGTPNNLRNGPSLNNGVIGTIPGGQQFTIVGGPQCSNNGAWWQVSYNGVTGWTMEGQGSTYWTEAINVGG